MRGAGCWLGSGSALHAPAGRPPPASHPSVHCAQSASTAICLTAAPPHLQQPSQPSAHIHLPLPPACLCRLDNAKQVSRLRQEFEQQARQIQTKYEAQLRALQEAAEQHYAAGGWAARGRAVIGAGGCLLGPNPGCFVPRFTRGSVLFFTPCAKPPLPDPLSCPLPLLLQTWLRWRSGGGLTSRG